MVQEYAGVNKKGGNIQTKVFKWADPITAQNNCFTPKTAQNPMQFQETRHPALQQQESKQVAVKYHTGTST
jgi:hypothetical protein